LSDHFIDQGGNHFRFWGNINIFTRWVLPVALWAAYLYLSVLSINDWPVQTALGFLVPQDWWIFQTVLGFMPSPVVRLYLVAFCVLTVIALCLQANGYSLHRFYRDRLSRAFLFDPLPVGKAGPAPIDGLKLSELQGSAGPYHIVNVAMNVQFHRGQPARTQCRLLHVHARLRRQISRCSGLRRRRSRRLPTWRESIRGLI
jgi:hypothetical protein